MQPRPVPRRWLAGSVAALISVLIHSLLVEAILLGDGGRAMQPRHTEGLGANAIASDTEAEATLVFIEDPGPAPANDDPLESLASHGPVLESFRLTIVSPSPSLDMGFDSEEQQQEETSTSSEEDAAARLARAALFGRYLGQIQARIERAWVRPRSAIGAELFECRVQILQSRSGNVLEVTLQRCNADARWQVSLVRAIERASPLPAPPDPAVFAESLQLSFESAAYVPGGNVEGFEPAVGLLAQTPDLTDVSRDADQIVRP